MGPRNYGISLPRLDRSCDHVRPSLWISATSARLADRAVTGWQLKLSCVSSRLSVFHSSRVRKIQTAAGVSIPVLKAAPKLHPGRFRL
jgi:hypothetical protein